MLCWLCMVILVNCLIGFVASLLFFEGKRGGDSFIFSLFFVLNSEFFFFFFCCCCRDESTEKEGYAPGIFFAFFFFLNLSSYLSSLLSFVALSRIETFFVRRLYARMCSCFNRPIASNPGQNI